MMSLVVALASHGMALSNPTTSREQVVAKALLQKSFQKIDFLCDLCEFLVGELEAFLIGDNTEEDAIVFLKEVGHFIFISIWRLSFFIPLVVIAVL